MVEYSIISADGHVDLGYLPWDLFTAQAPGEWKDKMPRVIEKNGTHQWWIDGTYLEDVGHFGDVSEYTLSMRHRVDRMASLGFLDDTSKGMYHPTDPNLRLKDQQLDGIDADVIYGLFFVGTLVEDQRQVAALYRIYNDWIAGFCKENPQRFAGLACLPSYDPKDAAAELRRASSIGLRGVELGVSTTEIPIYYSDWDVLWDAAAECGIPISFHSAQLFARQPTPEERKKYETIYGAIEMSCVQLDGAEFLASIILSGACERYPDFRFVLGECGATWIPFILDRMDHENQGMTHLKLNPTDYWRRQGHTTFQKEGFLGETINLIGADTVMWGSDYPHPDGVWPDSQETIAQNLKGIEDAEIRKKIVCDNAASLYKFI